MHSDLIPSAGVQVSVVIPAFNEEQNVPLIFAAVQSALPADTLGEIIFVDDGSSDGTAEQVRRLHARHVHVHLIRFCRNFGQQAALLAGLEAATGAAVITLDCDLQHPPELIPQMVQAWRDGAKIVQMVRVGTAGAGFIKRITSSAFYFLVNVFSETPVSPGAADFQLLDRVAVEAILQFKDRYPFVRGLVGWLGLATMQIQYAAPRRVSGKSGYSWRKMGGLSVQAFVGASSKPLRLSFYFGLMTAAFSVLYAAFAVLALIKGKTVPGWTSVIVMVTFIGSVQLVSIGIVGEYLARVYDQSRGTPRYIIVESTEDQPK